MNTGDSPERRTLAERMLQWHSGGGSAVYAVGSHWLGGHAPERDQILVALGELEVDHRTMSTRQNVDRHCGCLAASEEFARRERDLTELTDIIVQMQEHIVPARRR